VVQTPAPSPPPAPAPTLPPAGVYVVQSGDTLFDIASRLGVPVADLAAYNDLSDPGQIFAGQELQIPPEGSAAPEPADTAIVATVSTGGAQLNVRDAPSLTNSQVVTQLGDGDQVQLTGQTRQVDGVTWHETANGNWLHGDFLTLP
jgi:LysM repeat protein